MKTVTLETAKRLKEAGFPQDCDFYWQKISNDANTVIQLMYIPEAVELKDLKPHGELSQSVTYYASPSADEVLAQLPLLLKDKHRLHTLKTQLGWDVFYKPNNSEIDCLVIRMGDTLAEAAAKMWLYLKENKLI